MAALAPSTQGKYRSAVAAYMGFCLVERLDPTDMVEDQFMGFLLYMVECRKTVPRTGRQYIGDIAQIMIKQGLGDPYVEQMKSLRALVQRLTVLYPHTTKKRLPLVQQDFVLMWQTMVTTNRAGARFKALLLTMWQTVSRFDDLLNVKRADVTKENGHYVIHIAKHKMSYASNRFTQKMVAWPTYPGSSSAQNLSASVALRHYLSLDPTLDSQDPKKEYLFRTADGGKLQYQSMLKQLRLVLKAMGYNELDYGIHSPRVGGATCALSSSDGNEFITKQMGFWASDAVRLYCRPTKDMVVHIQQQMAETTATKVFNM
jgi:hypothetical protein